VTIWIDIEDFFGYASGHRRLSGIQRLTQELTLALRAQAGDDIGFVRHSLARNEMWVEGWPSVLAQFASMNAAGPADAGAGWDIHPANAPPSAPSQPPEQVLEPLAQAVRAQATAVVWLWRMAKGAVELSRDNAGGRRNQPLLREKAQPGDALCFFGLPQGDPRLFALADAVVKARDMRLAVLIHDIIRLRRPQFFMPDPQFERFVRWGVSRADHVLTVSQATARDVARWANSSGVALKRRPHPIPLGAGFGARTPTPLPAELEAGRYVLYVSTLEPRKNHIQAFQVWRRLLETRPRDEVPKLVFAGRVGWMAQDLLAALDSAGWLDGMVLLAREPTDEALAALYMGAAFTLFLSHDEGWGLPVSESLAFGKPCVASSAPSVREAGGDFCFYVDPDNTNAVYELVGRLLDQPCHLADMERRIRTAYRPRSWSHTAQAVLQAVDAPVRRARPRPARPRD
jgi:glycosyltransferase involved in cell wall biosynthesis